jgi:nanoRNase/pAp phosphatase (c-di-AMP/oligoRNAs hydrolase)
VGGDGAMSQENTKMEKPFPKSITTGERYKRLIETVEQEDRLAILIEADPDAMASALALKRLFWRKLTRASIYHINRIERADNLAMIKLLRIDQKHIRKLKRSEVTKWALVDSQPYHHKEFEKIDFDIIIDHHPLDARSKAGFVDIRESYGSNSTIMIEYLRAAKIRPSPRLATALFYAIKTDTDNFVRGSTTQDINAFRYLYPYANMNIMKKIESSEMTKQTLESYQLAMKRLSFIKDIAFVHMGKVENPDILVIIADFFMRLAEATWSVVSGVYGDKLIVILRNAGFRGDAGKSAQKLFGHWGDASAGGHKGAARAEVPLEGVPLENKRKTELEDLLVKTLRQLK